MQTIHIKLLIASGDLMFTLSQMVDRFSLYRNHDIRSGSQTIHLVNFM